MIAFLDIAFLTMMMWMLSKRLDALEDWQEEADERFSSLEAKK